VEEIWGNLCIYTINITYRCFKREDIVIYRNRRTREGGEKGRILIYRRILRIYKYTYSLFRSLIIIDLITVNDRFIVYSIKSGLLRTLSRSTASRTLLRSHEEPVVDVNFFSRTSDVLGSVGGEGRVVVWRVYEGRGEGEGEIDYEKVRRDDEPKDGMELRLE